MDVSKRKDVWHSDSQEIVTIPIILGRRAHIKAVRHTMVSSGIITRDTFVSFEIGNCDGIQYPDQQYCHDQI